MSKNVILKKKNEQIFPITTYENVLNAPEITETISSDKKLPTSKAVKDYVDNAVENIDSTFIDSSIHIGDTAPEINTKLWIDTTDDNLEKVESQSAVIESIQNAIYILQQKVSKLTLLRTNGIVSGSVTDSTLTELGNSAEPVIPAIIADQIEDDNEDTEFPEYAVETEPTVNHISIKMGTWRDIQTSKKFFINGELVWCTDKSTMYIYVNGEFKRVASSSSSPDDEPIIDDETMDTTELQQYLDNLDHINFIPVKDPESKYTVKVNEYGNLIVYNSNNDSVLPEPGSRGLYIPGYSNIGGLIINSFYLGGADKDEHSYQPCSHNFVEIANITYNDINLNGLCLMYTSGTGYWYKLPLWGICKAQSTFLVRGAQCSVMDVNTTKIKVNSFDLEWNTDSGLIKFDRGKNQATFYLCWCDLNNNNQIYIMSGSEDIKANNPTQLTNIFSADWKTVAKGYIDLVGVGNTSYYEKNAYLMPNGTSIDENTLFVRTYTIDPVTQSNGKGVAKRDNKKFWRHVNLSECVETGLERYTPKASYQNKNLSNDKHNFVENKPNTITCSFGIQATYKDASHPATRCFNWNSVGYYDEYVWYKKKTDSQWNRVESYKTGVDYSSSGLNRATDPACVKTGFSKYYTRIRWETFYGQPITTHKVMITGLTDGVYEYKVGRSDEQGNPTDYVSDVREFTVKSNSQVTSFDFIQTTDQQGANWEEYQTWSLSADFINQNERVDKTPKLANNEVAPINTVDFDFTINTGDITYNGSRPNEWIDYYDGYKYLDDKEEMFTLGNNDLAPVPPDYINSNDPVLLGMTLLGQGDERPDKVNHVVSDLFYTQEMDPNNPPEFEGFDIKDPTKTIKKTYKIPALYSFNYGDFHFISLNSEIRTYAQDDEKADVASTVTGEFGVYDDGQGRKAVVYDNVEDWLVRDLLIWKNNGTLPSSYDSANPKDHRFDPRNCQKAIIYTHEMPFTITAAATYLNYLTKTGDTYRETQKANLNRKHDFEFQRLFKIWGIRLVFGGHKHTCSISMPIYDAPTNFIPYEHDYSTNEDCNVLMASLYGRDTFNPIIQVLRTDNNNKWGLDAKVGYALDSFNYRGNIFNSTNTDVTVRNVSIASQSTRESNVEKPLCRYEIVDSISAPTYVMCQATGYKILSNSDTSDKEERCQWQKALIPGSELTSTDGTLKESKFEPIEQCYPFYTRYHVTNNSIDVNMYRVAGLYDPSSASGYWNVNRDMPNGHDAKMQDLRRKFWAGCEISLN